MQFGMLESSHEFGIINKDTGFLLDITSNEHFRIEIYSVFVSSPYSAH